MTEKRKVLGRGLDTLLPSRTATQPPSAHATTPAAVPMHGHGETVHQIPVELIDRNPYQTRRHLDKVALAELAASIKVSGVVQPITVRPEANGRFQLIAGERRWFASQVAEKTTVPAIVRHVSNEQAMEMTIIENLQREDLNPIEQARAFECLGREFGLTQEQIAQRTGKERSSVANFLRLLKLPADVQAMVEQGQLSLGHAKALMALDSPGMIQLMALRTVHLALSVRQTEKLVTDMMHPPEKTTKEREIDPNVKELERQIHSALGLDVTIQDRGGKGKVVIQYASLEDFDRIIDWFVDSGR
jgi:ParB family transcriptional regulator, chromosome partitioning protein